MFNRKIFFCSATIIFFKPVPGTRSAAPKPRKPTVDTPEVVLCEAPAEVAAESRTDDFNYQQHHNNPHADHCELSYKI